MCGSSSRENELEKVNQGMKITLRKAVIQSSFFIFINVKGIQNKEHGDNNKKMQPY